MDDLELWAGLECTTNRVGDVYRDQLTLMGHHERPGDLDLTAALGVRALRYAISWERVAPDAPGAPDESAWALYDARLDRLRALGVRVIAGLVHHGSGPRYTDLVSDTFAEGLAGHARNVAERYPWIEDWTPVNEPLTTARFSALYGHWYPHHRDERSFWIALLNQIDGVRLSMQAVRRVNPHARLIQTDDLGRTYATEPMQEQAAFDNARRWMGWDLLCGRVTPDHALWHRLGRYGLADRLRRIADDPCPPDIVGINHYLTSDRFLDHRVDRYPEDTHGNNGIQSYADVAAVRVLQPAPAGLAGTLREAWERYRLPLAITEVHNGCTREEQMRWTHQAWSTAQALRDEGVDLRAVTTWALFGSQDWNTLLTGPGTYEAGAFDVRGGAPRPTAMAGLLRTLAGVGPASIHPVVAGEGWWSRPVRFHHIPVLEPAASRDQSRPSKPTFAAGPPILIVGGRGTLGGALAAACRHRNLHHVATRRDEIDLDDADDIIAALDAYEPWLVINAAGWVRLDEAEGDPEGCFRANSQGAARLCRLAAERGIQTVSFSSDLVFDGAASTPYLETATPNPLNVYGRSKADAERAIGELDGTHLIVRTAAFFSPFDPHNFAMQAVAALREGRSFRAASDEVVSPTYVPDLCDTVLDLAIDGEAGLWHLSGGVPVSWAEFARQIAAACRLDAQLIEAVPRALLARAAPRPAFAALASERGQLLRSLPDAIARFADEVSRAEPARSSAPDDDRLSLTPRQVWPV
jgi:dTDP-4-dehydrorhamnose reductase